MVWTHTHPDSYTHKRMHTTGAYYTSLGEFTSTRQHGSKWNPFTHCIAMHTHLWKALCTFPFTEPCVHMNSRARAPVASQKRPCNAHVEITDRRRTSCHLPGNTGKYIWERKVPFVHRCNSRCHRNESRRKTENHDTHNGLHNHRPNLTRVPCLEKCQRSLKWP